MPTTLSRTRSAPRTLSDLAKHLSVPGDITSTGWPAVRNTCTKKLGVEFDDWQDMAGRLILAKRADGNLASMIDGVGLSLPRQVGKTYLIGALVFALCVNTPGLLCIWSAHHARTHGETFLAMQGMAERAKVAPFVDQVYTGSGTEEIRFHNGSRILFGARERGFGRGIPGVDVLIFDEAQILSDKAMSNMLATLNTSRFGLGLFIGTPPKPEDMSEAFTRMRTQALAGTLTDGAWIEFGAADGAKPDDRSQWRVANPSYPHRTPVQSMLRLQRKLTEADWVREGLGVWDEFENTESLLPFDPQVFKSLAVEDVVFDGSQVALSVSMTSKGELFVGAARWTAGRRVHGEIGYRGPSGPDALKYLLGLITRWNPVVLVVDRGDPAERLVPDLLAAGIEPEMTSTGLMAQAAGGLDDAVTAGAFSHVKDELLQAAVESAEKRVLVGGGWVFKSSGAVKAVALAHWGLVKFGSASQKVTPLPRKVQPVKVSASSRFGYFDPMSSGF